MKQKSAYEIGYIDGCNNKDENPYNRYLDLMSWMAYEDGNRRGKKYLKTCITPKSPK